MRIGRNLPKSFYRIGQPAPSPEAAYRHQVVATWEVLRDRGVPVDEACRLVGEARSNVYRWRDALRNLGPDGLVNRSRRPKTVRQPSWGSELVQAVLGFRERYPRWGKDKLVVLLRRVGWQVSTSMVGRILSHLKVRGMLKEAPGPGIPTRRRARQRPYAVRKPREYQASVPGDIVQIDTLDLRPLPGVILKHFTARDVVSRWDVLSVHTRATAAMATQFLHTLQERLPFPVKAIQVDGGSEFQAGFETACQEQGIKLFVLPPRSPKLNGHVERAQRTHTEEFYQLYDGDLTMGPLNRALRRWERVYNTIRPHQSLDGYTPAQYLANYHPQLAPPSHMS